MAKTKLNEHDAKVLAKSAHESLEALYAAYGKDSEEWQRGYFAAIEDVCNFFGIEHEQFDPLRGI